MCNRLQRKNSTKIVNLKFLNKDIMSRISIFYIIISFLLLGMSCDSTSQKKKLKSTNDVWNIITEVEKEIGNFTFGKQKFNISDFGAVGDGKTDNTEVFKKAIAQCSKMGGGMVIVPEGKFLTGAIHLEDNINLHLQKNAEILFSTNPEHYLPVVHTSFEGTEYMNYSPLIYAYKKKNIAITGKGILNGQASAKNWWIWCGKEEYGWKNGTPSQKDANNRDRLVQMAEDSVPVKDRIFGKGYFLRPNFIEPFECEKVLISGVTIVNAPFWIIHPIKCKNVLVDSVLIESHGPNNDGCDPEYSKNVIIRNSTFNTGDDCIAIKSGRDADGRRVGIKSENIIVQNCKMLDGHGGVVLGSEVSAGVSNVFVENCIMNSPNLDRAIRLKTNSKRGGLLENIYVRNLEIGTVREAVLKVNMFYDAWGNQTGNFIPEIRNIHLKNIKVKNGGYYAILAKGYKESPIQNITFENVVIEKVDNDFSLENVKNLKLIDTYINGELKQSNF